MIKIKLNIDDKEVKTMLGGMVKRMKNPRPFLEACGLVLLRSIGKSIKAGGQPVRWKPSKRALATGGQTLVDTGRLLRSIKKKVTGKVLQVGTDVKYAAIHDLGGTIPGRTIYPKRAKALRWIDKAGNVRFAKKVTIPPTKIPAREFLVIQDKDWREFVKIGEEYVVGSKA